jgi:hypothetical protein
MGKASISKLSIPAQRTDGVRGDAALIQVLSDHREGTERRQAGHRDAEFGNEATRVMAYPYFKLRSYLMSSSA